MAHSRGEASNSAPEETRKLKESGEEDSLISIPLVDFTFSTVSLERVKLYSDAVWAIIATIMILPIMHMKSIEELGKHSHNYTAEAHKFEVILPTIMKKLGIYYIAFLIICNSWQGHVWTLQPLKKATDFIALINLIVLLLASLLPYLYSVMSAYQQPLSIVIYCIDQILVGLVQLFLVVHIFSYEGLLRGLLEKMSNTEKKEIRWKIVEKLLTTPVFCLLALAFSFLHVGISFGLFVILQLYPWIKISCIYIYLKIRSINENKKHISQDIQCLSTRIPIPRIEGFSDGVFAITSTLLVVDITEKYVPTAKQVAASGLGHVMMKYGYTYGVFIAAFCVIGLLWFNHTVLFRKVFIASGLMTLLNSLILACVGVLPLSFSLWAKHNITNVAIWGLKSGTLAIFCIGVIQILIYLLAYHQDRMHRQNEEPWLCLTVQVRGDDFKLFMFQLVTLPLLSLIVFGVAFTNNIRATAITGLTFILLYGGILVVAKTLYFIMNPYEVRRPSHDHGESMRKDEYGAIGEHQE